MPDTTLEQSEMTYKNPEHYSEFKKYPKVIIHNSNTLQYTHANVLHCD
jgi:hypothetical protein